MEIPISFSDFILAPCKSQTSLCICFPVCETEPAVAAAVWQDLCDRTLHTSGTPTYQPSFWKPSTRRQCQFVDWNLVEVPQLENIT